MNLVWKPKKIDFSVANGTIAFVFNLSKQIHLHV